MRGKLTGIAVLIASSFLAPNYADAQFRGRRAMPQSSYYQEQSPAQVPQTVQAPKENHPIVYNYDTKIVIDEKMKSFFKDYLNRRLNTAKEISDTLESQYNAGVIMFDQMAAEVTTHLVFESALEAIATGDKNIYDMIIKHTSWRNDILLGLKKDLVKKNLDRKYEHAKKVHEYIEARYNYGGRVSRRELLHARGIVEDIEFLYQIMNLQPPIEPKKEPSEKPLMPPQLPPLLELPELPTPEKLQKKEKISPLNELLLPPLPPPNIPMDLRSFDIPETNKK